MQPSGSPTSLQTAPARTDFSLSEAPAGQSPCPPREMERAAESPAALPRGSYSLNWDELEDPNFNPFGGETRLPGAPRSSPARQGAGPVAAKPLSPIQPVLTASLDTPVSETLEGPAGEEGTQQAPPPPGPGSALAAPPARPAAPTLQDPELIPDLGEECFQDPAKVLGTGAEIDYLEQFGTSSFKESALRKQSLYLKFDPLLKDSPLRPGPAAPDAARTQDVDTPAPRSPAGVKLVPDLLGSPDTPGLQLPPCVLGPGGLPLPPGPIVEVLQYSQKDLDAAVEAVCREKQLLQSRCEELQARILEMGQIMDGFETATYQAMEDARKQKEESKAEIQKLLREKEQQSRDLRSLEGSFSDIFKRFEKQKEVIEGYRANEDSLKKCVEENLVRIEREAQRYQALKTQAEDKLQRANEEIAQVRSKASAEAHALQASLRREQMRVQSLEKAVEQKTKENEELTRICDDLISKMEKI